MENTISYIVVTFVNLKSCIFYLDFLFISLHFHPCLHLNDMKMASIFAVLSHSRPKLVCLCAVSFFLHCSLTPSPCVFYPISSILHSLYSTYLLTFLRYSSYVILLPSLLQLHLFPKRFRIPLKKGCKYCNITKLSQRENQGRS